MVIGVAVGAAVVCLAVCAYIYYKFYSNEAIRRKEIELMRVHPV